MAEAEGETAGFGVPLGGLLVVVAAISLNLRAVVAGAARRERWVENRVREGRWQLDQRRRCLAGKKPRVLLYGLQHGVGSAAVGGGDQVRERVLGVGAFVSRKHGEDSSAAVARRTGRRARSRRGGFSLLEAMTNARAARAETVTCSRTQVGGCCGCVGGRGRIGG